LPPLDELPNELESADKDPRELWSLPNEASGLPELDDEFPKALDNEDNCPREL